MKIIILLASITLLGIGCGGRGSQINTSDDSARPRKNIEQKIITSAVILDTSTSTTTSTSRTQSNIFYKNNLLNFSFRIPATTLIAYETDTNSKMGVFVRFEGPDFNPGYITFNSSNGEYFKRSSEVSEGELGHVDWWTDYEEYQKKVITKKTTLDEYERIISLNTRTYLETIFYDLGGENYLLNVVTYHKNKKYSLTYNFPAQWHDNTYSWSVENRKKVIQEIQKQSIPEPYLTNLKKFWTIVRSLSLE